MRRVTKERVGYVYCMTSRLKISGGGGGTSILVRGRWMSDGVEKGSSGGGGGGEYMYKSSASTHAAPEIDDSVGCWQAWMITKIADNGAQKLLMCSREQII
jgi:hypothetical protein